MTPRADARRAAGRTKRPDPRCQVCKGTGRYKTRGRGHVGGWVAANCWRCFPLLVRADGLLTRADGHVVVEIDGARVHMDPDADAKTIAAIRDVIAAAKKYMARCRAGAR